MKTVFIVMRFILPFKQILREKERQSSILSVSCEGALVRGEGTMSFSEWGTPPANTSATHILLYIYSGTRPFRQLAEVQNSQARQMLHGKASTTWLKSFCHTSLNLGHYSWAEPVSQQQLSNWLLEITRQLNVSEERAFPLKTAVIYIFQK